VSSTSALSATALTEHRLRWAFGAVLLWHLLFPFFDSPLQHLFSDPDRHWGNGARFLDPDPIGAGDPYLYQLWIYLLRKLTADSAPAIQLVCGVLCAAMPYGWYRALKELLPRNEALVGAIVIGLVPGLWSMYAYFMNETLLLTLTGFAFWLTFRCRRKGTLGAWTLACLVWSCTIFTRTIALPMAVLCLGTVWLLQPRDLFLKALIAVIAFALLAVPAGMHARSKLGFFAPLGNVHLSEIYSGSGNRNIELDFGSVGRWGFGTPSFYNPTFYPFSDWTTDRQGTVSVKIDLSRGEESWIAERDRVIRASTFSRWQRFKENFLYLLFAQSWPDNDLNSLSGLLAVWSRWLWPPVMLFVAWGAVRREYMGREWLLPACALGMLVFLQLQTSGIIEGRYRKPIDPILLAAAIVQYFRMRSITPATGVPASGG
jgi:hypothetical protein